MTIRLATPAEIAIIKRNADKVREEASMGYLKDSTYADDLSSFENSFYLVAVEHGVLQGWALVGETFDFYQGQSTGIILELYVFKPFRKKGMGEKLMKSSIQYFRNRGMNRIQLNVFAGNPAKKLYQKLGFKEISTFMELRNRN
jgi:GNAT superfamily N-acetyltransferase